MDGTIFRPIFVPDELREAVSGRAWLQAMLDAEAALATAEAQVGLIPHEAAAAIVSCCEATRFDPEELGRDGRAAGNPVPPLVNALTAAVSEVSEDVAFGLLCSRCLRYPAGCPLVHSAEGRPVRRVAHGHSSSRVPSARRWRRQG